MEVMNEENNANDTFDENLDIINLTKEQIFERYIDLLKSYNRLKVTAQIQLDNAMLDHEALEEEIMTLTLELSKMKRLQYISEGNIFTKSEKNNESVTTSFELPSDLLECGKGKFAKSLLSSFVSNNGSNVLSIKFGINNANILLSGGADKSLSIIKWRDAQILQQLFLLAPVICISFRPKLKENTIDIACVTCMDGSVYIIHVDENNEINDTLRIIQHIKIHTKYVMRVSWASDASLLATVSNDKTACLFKLKDLEENLMPEYEIVKTFHFRNNPEALCFSGNELIVAESGMLHLHYINTVTLESNDVSINNEDWDTHVSFTIRDLSICPNNKYLLAATDSNSHILYSLHTNKQLKRFVGHRSEGYGSPKLLWHPSGKYIYSNSQDERSVFCWDIVTENIVVELKDHSGAVKDLDYLLNEEILVSCGFDKTVKIWN